MEECGFPGILYICHYARFGIEENWNNTSGVSRIPFILLYM